MLLAHQFSLTQPRFFKCLYQGRKVSGHVFVCCGVSIFPLCTLLILDFRNASTVWYYLFLFFIILLKHMTFHVFFSSPRFLIFKGVSDEAPSNNKLRIWFNPVCVHAAYVMIRYALN